MDISLITNGPINILGFDFIDSHGVGEMSVAGQPRQVENVTSEQEKPCVPNPSIDDGVVFCGETSAPQNIPNLTSLEPLVGLPLFLDLSVPERFAYMNKQYCEVLRTFKEAIPLSPDLFIPLAQKCLNDAKELNCVTRELQMAELEVTKVILSLMKQKLQPSGLLNPPSTTSVPSLSSKGKSKDTITKMDGPPAKSRRKGTPRQSVSTHRIQKEKHSV